MAYSANIPEATTNPSADQPLIQANFQAISTAFNLNHGNFDDPDQGKHDLVDFVRQSIDPTIPSANANEGLIFGALVEGATELFYGRDSTEAKQMTGVEPSDVGGGTATSFSWDFIDGLSIRFGDVVHTGTNTPIVFDTVFPNTVYVVLFSPQGAAALETANNVQALTTSGFSLNSTSIAPAESRYFYIALGR